jgi:hypothetical protein
VPSIIVYPYHKTFGDESGDPRTEESFTRERGADGIKDLLLPCGFEQVRACARPQDLIGVFFVLEHDKDDDLDVGMWLFDLPSRLDPIKDRHGNIQDGYIGAVFLSKADRLFAVSCWHESS